MSETEFVLFQNIIGGIETFLYAVCLTAFFYPFMTEKKERQGSKLKKILIVFGSYIAISLIGNFVPAYGWLGLMIVIILLTASSGYLGMNRNFTFFMGIIFFYADCGKYRFLYKQILGAGKNISRGYFS